MGSVVVDSVGVVASDIDAVGIVVAVVDSSAAAAREASVVVVDVDTVVAADNEIVVVAQVVAVGYVVENNSGWAYQEILLRFLASLVDAENVVTLVY